MSFSGLDRNLLGVRKFWPVVAWKHVGNFPPLYFHYKWAVITRSAAACKRICPELLIVSVQADPVAVPGVTSRTAAVVFVPRGVLGYFLES